MDFTLWGLHVGSNIEDIVEVRAWGKKKKVEKEGT